MSWAVRGLRSAAVQTQHCELWQANLGGSCSCKAGTCSAAEGSSKDSLPCSAQSSRSRCSSAAASEGRRPAPAAGAAAEEEPAGRVMPLPALQQQIREIYRSKAQHDIAVARGQRPFLPLADFVASYLAQQHGSDGYAVEQRAQQLQASVEAHACVFEVAMFGLAAGMLEEGEGAVPSYACLLVDKEAAMSPQQVTAASCAASQPAAAVPLVLYHSRRRGGSTAEQQQRAGAPPALRRFCAASWHAAYQRSAGRCPLPQPFNPAGADQLLPGMASEVHNQALGVPGIEQLMCWVLGGGLGGCLPQLDLGLRLAETQVGLLDLVAWLETMAQCYKLCVHWMPCLLHESCVACLPFLPPARCPLPHPAMQVPQLYLLAVESCRLLGISSTPQLYIKNSAEPAAYYLLLPAQARLHGLAGSMAEQPAMAAGLAGQQPEAAFGSSGSSGVTGAAGAEGQDWQCALVLTSGLLDLLEPQELQGVVAGCLGFHAALTSLACREAPQLAVLCRSMAALATLGALCTLGPEALAQRLPHQMAPFFHSRMQPLLLRALRYLSLYCDRVAAAALGSWRPVAAAVIKQAAGCSLLRNELNLQAVLQQARALEEAAAELLPQALLHEEAATVAGASASLSLLRVRELQKWQAGRL